jgi:Bacterial regulatory proteins, gntR family
MNGLERRIVFCRSRAADPWLKEHLPDLALSFERAARDCEQLLASGGHRKPAGAAMEADLRRRIAAGEWMPGEALPTHDKLGACWGVSRPIVSKVLQVLAADGLIVCDPGQRKLPRARAQAGGGAVSHKPYDGPTVDDLPPVDPARLAEVERVAAERKREEKQDMDNIMGKRRMIYDAILLAEDSADDDLKRLTGDA